MQTKRFVPLLLSAAVLVGAGAGIAGVVSAQTTTPSGTSSQPTVGAPQAGHPRWGGGPHIDGNVTAVNGTTITLQEEADEGSTVYTVDASNATVMKDGASSQLSGVAVGDKIFVDGTVNGSTVTATRIMDGRPPQGPKGPGMFGHRHPNMMHAPSSSSATSQ